MSKKVGFRVRNKMIKYTQVPNTLIDDVSVSIQARFIYTVIMRRMGNNEEWTIYKDDIRSFTGMSEETFHKYWREIIKKGYIKQYKFRDEHGKWAYDYELFPTPQLDKKEGEKSEKDVDGENDWENDGELKKQKGKNSKTPKNVDITRFKDGGKNHTLNFGGVKISPGENMGVYNNTNPNKTNINNTKRDINISQREKNEALENKVKLIEDKTGLKLTEAQIRRMKGWKEDKMMLALNNYVTYGGKSFKYLEGCYSKPIVSTPKKSNVEKSHGTRFNNFTPREYDYEALERKALGWDNDDV